MKGEKSDSTPRQIARLLRALAAVVEVSSPNEVTSLLEAELSQLKGSRRSAFEDPRVPLESTPDNPSDLLRLAETLQGLRSRDEGMALLSSASLTRKELERLGRLLGTAILKTDNMERLTDKIIETSIGSRLTSEAIRGDRAQ